LFTGARGLDHLVDGAVALVQEPAAEEDGRVENDLRFLVGAQFSVAAVGGDEAVLGGHRLKDRKDERDTKDNSKVTFVLCVP
jgi:hypothetical protein